MRSWVRWLAMFGGGSAAGLCVGLLRLKVWQQNLEPTPLLQAASLLLLGLGVGLPWLATGRRMRRRRS